MKIRQLFLISHRPHGFGDACLLIFLAAAILCWPLCATGQQPVVPKLTLAQVEQLVAHGVPDSTLSSQIQKRGLAFTPSPTIVESLRAKGAGPLTLAVIEAPLAHTETPGRTTSSVAANPQQSKRLDAEGLRFLSGPRPDLNSAKRAFEQAVQLDPNNIQALNNLGYVDGKLGNYSSAEAILIKVIDLAPTRRVAQGNLGEVQAKLGKTQEASKHFCQYVRLFDSLERGKSILMRAFNDPDPKVQSAVSLTLANCN